MIIMMHDVPHLEQLPADAAHSASGTRDEDCLARLRRCQLATEVSGHAGHAEDAQVCCIMMIRGEEGVAGKLNLGATPDS